MSKKKFLGQRGGHGTMASPLNTPLNKFMGHAPYRLYIAEAKITQLSCLSSYLLPQVSRNSKNAMVQQHLDNAGTNMAARQSPVDLKGCEFYGLKCE